MAAIPKSVVALLLSTALMASANGLQMTLISVRAGLETFDAFSIGLLVSAYYAGFLLGCLYAGRLVSRSGHTRAFLALAGVFSAAMLVHILFVGPIVWIGLRVVVGFALAGLYMIIESWLNDKATDANRGRVLASYRFIELSALTSGQLLLAVISPDGFQLFCMVAILVSLSLVPLALSNAEGPSPIADTKIDVKSLMAISPLAAFGCFTIGVTGSIVFGLGPVFAQSAGGDGAAQVGYFMSAFIVGGALAQVPLGRLSDRMDRRYILSVVAILAAGAAILITMAGDKGGWALILAAALYGAFALSHYSILIAHANDRADPSHFVKISGGLMLLYSVGAIVGPALSSIFVKILGLGALFGLSAIFHLALAGFALLRISVRERVAEEDREDFVAVVRSTPEIFELDPRGELEAEEDSVVRSAPCNAALVDDKLNL